MGLNGKRTLPDSAAVCRKDHTAWSCGSLAVFENDAQVIVIKTVAPTWVNANPYCLGDAGVWYLPFAGLGPAADT